MRHTAAAVLVTILLPSLAAAGEGPSRDQKPAQTVTQDFAAMKIAAWETAVRTHAAGRIDEPARTIASWPRAHVSVVVSRLTARLRRLLDARDDPAAQDLPGLTAALARGLSLHTDIAIAERETLGHGSSPRPGAAVLLIDGRETRFLERSYHWLVARQIATALADVPSESPRVLSWYRAVAAGLEEAGDYDVVGVHLEAALTLFPRDAMLALYQGTLHQTLGDARLQQYIRGHPRDVARRVDGSAWPQRRAPGRPQPTDRPVDRPPASELRRVPKASQTELEAAEREFRHALSIDPTLHEARTRLAHVLSTLGDDRGAADTVRPALEASLSPFGEFYAALILGRSEEHLGRYTEADEAYARAAARFPGAQSARIGRSRVALVEGRAAEALAGLVDGIAFGDPGSDDPWLSYLRTHDPDGKSLLDAWRATLK